MLFDVKDFGPTREISTGSVHRPVHSHSARRLDQGVRSSNITGEYCCGLYAQRRPSVSCHLTSQTSCWVRCYGARVSDSGGLRTGVGDASQLKRAFLGRGKMIRPNWSKPDNTTISALVTVVSIQPHFQRLLDLVRENPRGDNENRDFAIEFLTMTQSLLCHA